jgi:hypothetical protein
MKRLLILSALLCFLMFSPVAYSASVFFDVSPLQDGGDLSADLSYELQVGDTFWVNIYASDLPAVFTMSFNVSYDDQQLDVLNLGVGTPWPNNPTMIDDGVGKIQFGGAAAPGETNSGDNILLAYLQLECLAPGLSDLVSMQTDLGGAGFYGMSGEISGQIDFDTLAVTQSQVPIPSAIFLLGGGLLGLIGIRRRKG